MTPTFSMRPVPASRTAPGPTHTLTHSHHTQAPVTAYPDLTEGSAGLSSSEQAVLHVTHQRSPLRDPMNIPALPQSCSYNNTSFLTIPHPLTN